MDVPSLETLSEAAQSASSQAHAVVISSREIINEAAPYKGNLSGLINRDVWYNHSLSSPSRCSIIFPRESEELKPRYPIICPSPPGQNPSALFLVTLFLVSSGAEKTTTSRDSNLESVHHSAY